MPIPFYAARTHIYLHTITELVTIITWYNISIWEFSAKGDNRLLIGLI